MPNQEPVSAWIFGNSSVRVGTQGLFRPYLKTFVPPFLPTRLTCPGSPRMPPPLLSFLHLLRKLPRRLLWNLDIHFGMTVIWLQYCKDQDRRTLVDLFYQDDQFMNSGNAFVQDSYSEKVSYKVAWMLSCLGGDLVECCFIISILSKGVRTLHSVSSWRHRLFLFPWL